MAQHEDVEVLEEFERQCDNLLLSLSSVDFSSESNFPECRFGDVTDQFIDACRALDAWFIQKRLVLNVKCPEYQLADEVANLWKELEDKKKYAMYLRQKISDYVSSIDKINKKLTEGVVFVPDA